MRVRNVLNHSLGVIALQFALIAFTAGAVQAGAWTQPKTHGYYEISTQMLRGDDYRDRDGFATLIPTLSEYTVSLYAEYGLLDNVTLVGYAPLFKRITLNEQIGRDSDFVYFGGDAVQGIADAELGVRYRLLDSPAGVVSAALTLGLPLGDDSHPNGLLTGDGEFDQQLSLLFGRSLYPLPGYLGLEIAYGLRHSGYADDVSVRAEAGMSWRRWSFSLRAQTLESLDNGDESVRGGAGGLYGNDRRYLIYGPKVGMSLGQDLQLSVSAMVASRLRNAIAAPSLSVGLSRKR